MPSVRHYPQDLQLEPTLVGLSLAVQPGFYFIYGIARHQSTSHDSFASQALNETYRRPLQPQEN